MNKTISVHFRLKKRSSYVVGKNLPIYLRLTIDGERTEFSTQREIDPEVKCKKRSRYCHEERRDAPTQQFS